MAKKDLFKITFQRIRLGADKVAYQTTVDVNNKKTVVGARTEVNQAAAKDADVAHDVKVSHFNNLCMAFQSELKKALGL